MGDERMCLLKPEDAFTAGHVGVVVSSNKAGFRNVHGSIRWLAKDGWTLNPDGSLSVLNKQDHGFDRLILKASDGYGSAFKQVELKP